MADEDDVLELTGALRSPQMPKGGGRPDQQLRPPTAEELESLPKDINPRGYSKWPLDRFVQAAHEGDLELLRKMLDREDPIDGYHHDFNGHLHGVNALH
ncbi:unnamed protein product, partial [Polarella glacialis]